MVDAHRVVGGLRQLVPVSYTHLFRAACDKFFERKASHIASVDGEHEENLQQKLALLDEMASADVKAGGYDVIRELQRRWGEIG